MRLHTRRHRHVAQQRHQRQRQRIGRQQDGVAPDHMRLDDDSSPVSEWG